MKNKILLFLSTCLVTSFAFAQIDLGEGLNITHEQLRKIQQKLPRTTEEKRFIHWTNRASGMDWIAKGIINQGVMDHYNIPTGQLQAHGPGLYLAETHTSSKNFGEIPVSVTVRKGQPIYDPKIIEEVLGKTLTDAQASRLGVHIPLIRPIGNDWYLTNHTDNTNYIRYGKVTHPGARVYVQHPSSWSQFNLAKDFKDLLNAGDRDAIYLWNIIHASDYMDGISFARAMVVNPGAPWNEFEPENFEGYKKSMWEFTQKKDQLTALGLDGVKKALVEVNNTFTGKPGSRINHIVRNEGVRAGGDEVGKTFLATTKQVETMKANPYLTVTSVPHSGDLHRVYYSYPDVFHYEKLKDRIPKTYSELQHISKDQLWQNTKERQRLNKLMMEELIDDWAARMKEGTGIWKDLISIHPFADFNGRSTRMLQEIFNQGSSHFFIGDLDILLPANEQQLYWDMGAKAHAQFQADLIDEFLLAKTQKRMPDYLKTDALNNYVNHAFSTPMNLDLNDHETLELIRKRQWPLIMEKGKKGGLSRFLKTMAKPGNDEIYLPMLLDFTVPGSEKLYTNPEQKQILTILRDVFRKAPADPMSSLSHYGGVAFQRYNDFYKAADPSVTKEFIPPFTELMTLFDDPKSKQRAIELLSTLTMSGPQAFTVPEQEKIMNVLIKHIREAPLDDFNLAGVLGDYERFYDQVDDPALKKKFASGFDEFLKIYNNPLTREKGLILLRNFSQPWNIGSYSSVKQKKILGVLKEVVTDPNAKLFDRMSFYGSYNEFYTQVPASIKAGFPKPGPIQASLLDLARTTLMNPKLTKEEITAVSHSIQTIENDFVRGMNRTLSFITEDVPPQARRILTDSLASQLDMFTTNGMFQHMGHVQQRRMLLTTKGFIDRMIELKDKVAATRGLDVYRKAYASTDAGMRPVTKPEELKAWTKKTGFSDCSLIELLAKLK